MSKIAKSNDFHRGSTWYYSQREINKVKKYSKCRYCGITIKGYMSFCSNICYQNFKLTELYKIEKERRAEIKNMRPGIVRPKNEFEDIIIADGYCLECGKILHSNTKLQFCSNGCLTTYKIKKGINLATQCVVCHTTLEKDQYSVCSCSCSRYMIWTRKGYADEMKEIVSKQPRNSGQQFATYA